MSSQSRISSKNLSTYFTFPVGCNVSKYHCCDIAKDYVPSIIFPTTSHNYYYYYYYNFGSTETPPNGLVTPRSPPGPSSTSESNSLSPPGNSSPDPIDVCRVIRLKVGPGNDPLFQRIKQARENDYESQEFKIG